MTSLAADIDATFNLIERNAEELRKKDPEHELLQFAAPVLETEEWTKETWIAYIEKFAKEKGTTVLKAMLNYLIALEGALGKRKEEVDA